MQIFHKLILGFLFGALLVGFVGGVSIFTNKEIANNISLLAESSIDEVRGATEMTAALQTLQLKTQELVATRYRHLTHPLDTQNTNLKLQDIDQSIEQAISAFEQWVLFNTNATMTGVILAQQMNLPLEADAEEDELDDISAMQVQFEDYKQMLSEFRTLNKTNLNFAYEIKISKLDPLLAKLRSDVYQLETNAENELKSKGILIKEAASRANKILITATASALILAFIFGLSMSNSISKPLVSLSEAAKKIGSGHLNTRIRVNRKDELGVLANSFNSMVKELQIATQSLENAANYNDNIVQCMQDTLIVISNEGIIQRANLSCLKLLGYEKYEIIGMSITEIAAKNGNYFSQFDIDHILATDGVQGTEVTYKTNDGHKLPMLFSGAVMHDDNRQIQGLVCVAQDLSIIKLADEQIRATNEKLLKTNNQLTSTQSQLVHSAKLASVGEMATGVAHELNQPLSIISMNADLRLSEIQENNFSHVEASYELILAQISRATTIINHLRTFGRESNTLSYSLYSINQIIEDSFILISEQLRLFNINIVKNLGENLPLINCNHIQIEQIFTNLLLNAKDALENAESRLITVKSYAADGYVIIEVADTGTGISPTNLKKIFDPFYTSKEVGKGTGLGLSISYGIAANHAGHLSATSQESQGSTFRLALPIQKEATA